MVGTQAPRSQGEGRDKKRYLIYTEQGHTIDWTRSDGSHLVSNNTCAPMGRMRQRM
jgi:hypothetical protein